MTVDSRPHPPDTTRQGALWRSIVGCCALVLTVGCTAPSQGILPTRSRTVLAPPAAARVSMQSPDSEIVRRLPPVTATQPPSYVQPAALIVPRSNVAPGNASQSFAVGRPYAPAAEAGPVPATYQEVIPRPPSDFGGPHTPSLTERLQIPAELPGTNVPPLWLPPLDQPAQRLQAIDTLFPDLPPMPKLLPPMDPQRQFSLSDLEQMAIANSPIIVQAEADITVAFGQAIQAGVYPNPLIGYEADTVGSAGTRNYQASSERRSSKLPISWGWPVRSPTLT